MLRLTFKWSQPGPVIYKVSQIDGTIRNTDIPHANTNPLPFCNLKLRCRDTNS
ncbi:hypothetical protein WN55_00631 [Dufourea novaeangliae]|uniref:Uncharacterized protein n=1 Tax=Dufourea novaeangliae TaxID=178035 RepID=A0A154NY06_DUFNO|nr:hypothetical protein WN55_00631 [Dufourea novaeangliae]